MRFIVHDAAVGLIGAKLTGGNQCGNQICGASVGLGKVSSQKRCSSTPSDALLVRNRIQQRSNGPCCLVETVHRRSPYSNPSSAGCAAAAERLVAAFARLARRRLARSWRTWRLARASDAVAAAAIAVAACRDARLGRVADDGPDPLSYPPHPQSCTFIGIWSRRPPPPGPAAPPREASRGVHIKY